MAKKMAKTMMEALIMATVSSLNMSAAQMAAPEKLIHAGVRKSGRKLEMPDQVWMPDAKHKKP
jgi:hypothetical protein